MLLLSMKMYLALLWGISALFSTESMSVSTPATSNISSTSTTKRLIGEDVVHTESTAWHKTDKPAEVGSAGAETTAAPTADREEVFVTDRSDSSNDMTTTSVAMSTVATTASNSASQQLHTSAAVSTAAGEAQRSSNTTISETVKPTKDQLHQHTPATLIDVNPSVTTSAASSATDSVSSPQPTSTNEPEVASSLSSTTSPADSVSTTTFIQNLRSPSASTSTMTVNPTSEAATDTTYSSSSKNETSNTSTELSSTPQPASMTRSSISTSDAVGASSTTEASTILASAGSTAESSTNLDSTSSSAESSTISFTTDSANSTTEAVSNSTTGVFIHRVPKRLPIPTTKSTPPVPSETSKSLPHTDVQPCSTRGLVTQSLIAIACLAVLATIFMVTTVILCTKLSTRKYRIKKPQQATEMMCISALLPESDYSYTRRRNPVTNGILVMHHHGGDSDEDGVDNLTLSSFLPENDRYV